MSEGKTRNVVLGSHVGWNWMSSARWGASHRVKRKIPPRRSEGGIGSRVGRVERFFHDSVLILGAIAPVPPDNRHKAEASVCPTKWQPLGQQTSFLLSDSITYAAWHLHISPDVQAAKVTKLTAVSPECNFSSNTQRLPHLPSSMVSNQVLTIATEWSDLLSIPHN